MHQYMAEPRLRLQLESPPMYSAALANEDLQVGSALLRYEPLAMIPLEEEKIKRCSRCLKGDLRGTEPILCGRCRCESYCSNACQSVSQSSIRDIKWTPNVPLCRQRHGMG